MATSILLADDHGVVRAGLRLLIERETDMKVIAEATDGASCVELAQALRPDVVVMDIAMPHLGGIEATRQLIGALPQTRVLALSIHTEPQFVVEMLKAGAVGYIVKEGSPDELIQAIRAVLDGRMYVSPLVADFMVREYVRTAANQDLPPHSLLTDRQCEVLQLLAEGKSSKEIALELDMGVKTVETHRYRIMEKLDIHSVAALTKYAIREGLTSLRK